MRDRRGAKRPEWAMRARDESSSESDADRQTASLSGLAVTLLLIVAGLLVVHALRVEARLEDCLLAGRLVCAAGMPP
ncbi:MAG: hypothetical protein JOY66_12195 [Acetobacteraceae bacterium]|nr:hypothetical protein [Acetobacteraceae bacterium]